MIDIAVCDDSPAHRKVISALLEKYSVMRGGLEIQQHKFESGVELIKSIESGKNFHLFLLDIIMPELDGIKLTKNIRSKNEDAVVIFLTSSKEYALEAFEVSAIQYLLKPITKPVFFNVLDKTIPLINISKERFFLFSASDSDFKIPFSSIICVEHFSRRIRIHLKNKKILTGKYLRSSFTETTAPLLLDEHFICVHKSFIVNLIYAEALTSNAFILKNDIMVPISRHKYTKIKKIYHSSR